MPGGQYTNLRQQAKSLGLEDRWPEICRGLRRRQPAVRRHRQGDAVEQGRRRPGAVHGHQRPDRRRTCSTARGALSFPRSVVEMMQGLLGEPEGGWPKAFQKIVLDSAGVEADQRPAGRDAAAGRFRRPRQARLAAKIEREPRDEDVLSYLLYPQVFLDFQKHWQQYGDTSAIPTPNFFYGLQPRRGDRRRDRARQDADRQVPDDRRAARGRHADGLLRAERPAARGPRADRSVEGDAQAASQGRPGRPEPRRGADAGQGVDRRRARRARRSRQASGCCRSKR